MHEDLRHAAEQKFGKVRAGELLPDLEKLASDVEAINEHPLKIEDEL